MQVSENGVESGLTSGLQPYDAYSICLQMMLKPSDLHSIAPEGSPKTPAHSQVAWHTEKQIYGTASSDTHAAYLCVGASDCTNNASDYEHMAGQLQDYGFR